MLTPQGELRRLSEGVNRLCDFFDSDEDEVDFRTCMNNIYREVQQLSSRIDMMQEQMSLIIKLLSKPNVG